MAGGGGRGRGEGKQPATSSSSSSRSRGQQAWVPRGPGPERSSECQKEGPYSSSSSVSSKKTPQQMATPVQTQKSVDSPPQTVTPVQPPKSADSPPQMVTPVQPPATSSSSRGQKAHAPGGERFSEFQKEGPYSSSTSVSSKKTPQQMVTPVQTPKSVDSPPQIVTPVQPPRSADSPPQMVTPVQPPATSSSWRQKARNGPGHGRSSEGQKEGPCSSFPSVSGKKSQPQMVASLQLSDSVDSRGQERSSEYQKEGPCPSASDKKAPLPMVTPVPPAKPLDKPIPMVASGSVGSDSGPFDICMDNNNGSFKLKRPLIDINREKRRANRVAPPFQRLRLGMVLLKNFVKTDDQVKIIQHCRRLGVGIGGFYTPGYRDGAKLNLKMMCLGKNWDPESSSYGDKRPFDGAQPPNIPEVLTKFVKDALEASHEFLKAGGEASDPSAELPLMSPDICIVNFYTNTGRLGLHQDKDETEDSLNKGLPVVSFSLGDTAEFLYGDERDDAKASKVDLESGDVLIFGGQSRHIFHGVSKIKPKTAPEALTVKTNLQPGRLNLTFRQYKFSAPI